MKFHPHAAAAEEPLDLVRASWSKSVIGTKELQGWGVGEVGGCGLRRQRQSERGKWQKMIGWYHTTYLIYVAGGGGQWKWWQPLARTSTRWPDRFNQKALNSSDCRQPVHCHRQTTTWRRRQGSWMWRAEHETWTWNIWNMSWTNPIIIWVWFQKAFDLHNSIWL